LQIKHTRLAGEGIKNILIKAPGNKSVIGGVKVVTENDRFAARPPLKLFIKYMQKVFLAKSILKKLLMRRKRLSMPRHR
jgi:phosphoglucomutase